jgi:hypothetical protein
MRQWRLADGRGFLTYRVLEGQDPVDLLTLVWLA